MKKFDCYAALAMLTMLAMQTSFGQAPPTTPSIGGIAADDPSKLMNSGRGGERNLGDYVDTVKAMNRKNIKDVPKKEDVMQRANELISAINLACQAKDAELVGLNTDSSNGKIMQTSIYEVACSNGLGYFIASRDRIKKEGAKPGAPVAANITPITCITADGIHEQDIAKGEKSDFYCQLPGNGGGELKDMGERLLTKAGVTCKVAQFKWFGSKAESKTEISEAACDNGTGYLLETALPGGNASPIAMNCNEAARKGLECKMTPVVMPPTLLTFKEYLATTGVNCKIGGLDQIKDQVKVLGQESTRQRYVVEFKCPQQPKGLVAYIPLNGNTSPFETIDCASAAKRGLTCKLTSN